MMPTLKCISNHGRNLLGYEVELKFPSGVEQWGWRWRRGLVKVRGENIEYEM